jgi:hypothetical protein
MKMRAWKILTVVLSVLVVAAAAYARSAPMVQHDNIAIQSDKPLTLEQVKKAILQASSQRRWTASVRDANRIRLSYSRGQHSAIIDVAYTTKSYSIRYVDSQNLNYDAAGPTIHPTYNGWVNSLKAGIDTALLTI